MKNNKKTKRISLAILSILLSPLIMLLAIIVVAIILTTLGILLFIALGITFIIILTIPIWIGFAVYNSEKISKDKKIRPKWSKTTKEENVFEVEVEA